MKPSELLANPENWTKGSFSRNAQGNYVAPRSNHATCWCLMGALMRCGVTELNSAVIQKLNGKFEGNLARFNDAPDTTHADILTLLKSCDL